MFQKKSEIEHRKVPLPCGLVVACSTPDRLMMTGNRIVSGDAPSKYLDRLKKYAGVSDGVFHDILLTHVVNPEFMKSDDFSGFFRDRKEKILKRIESAMGKTIAREQVVQEEGTFNEPEEEGDDDNMTITP